MSGRLEAFARRVREVQKWKVLYGEKQRLLGKSLKNSTRLMKELIQLERRKPEDVRLVRVMPGLLDALSREKQILERLGASNATFRDYSGFRDFLQRLSEERPPLLKAQAWEAQCSNKQRLLLNSMKKTIAAERGLEYAPSFHRDFVIGVAWPTRVGTDEFSPLAAVFELSLIWLATALARRRSIDVQ